MTKRAAAVEAAKKITALSFPKRTVKKAAVSEKKSVVLGFAKIGLPKRTVKKVAKKKPSYKTVTVGFLKPGIFQGLTGSVAVEGLKYWPKNHEEFLEKEMEARGLSEKLKKEVRSFHGQKGSSWYYRILLNVYKCPIHAGSFCRDLENNYKNTVELTVKV